MSTLTVHIKIIIESHSFKEKKKKLKSTIWVKFNGNLKKKNSSSKALLASSFSRTPVHAFLNHWASQEFWFFSFYSKIFHMAVHSLHSAVLSMFSAVTHYQVTGFSQYPGKRETPNFQSTWHSVHLQHQGSSQQAFIGRHLLDTCIL